MPTRDSAPTGGESTGDVVTVIVDPAKFDTCTRGLPQEMHREQFPAPEDGSIPESREKPGGIVGGKREGRRAAPDFTSIRIPT